MPLRDTSRSIEDLLYSLGNSLQKFKGDNGLKRFLDAGRLSWLSFVGEFQETHDELFSRRTYSLNSTRKCLITLNDLFEDVTRYATKMSEKVNEISKTLDQFHRCCDLELENPEQANDDSSVVAEEKLTQMTKVNAEIREALSDFCNSASTCKTLNASTVFQLEHVDKETAGGVGKAQTDFDAQRRRVQLKEDEVGRLRAMGLAPGNAQLQFAEFNLQCEKEALQAAGDAYLLSLQDAMSATCFGLEQTCMATWASSNVFFVQYATFLHELGAQAKTISRLLVDIKNSQSVSRQIGVERKAMLEALHPKPAAPTQASACVDHAQALPLASVAVQLDDLFGPPVAEQPVVQSSFPPTAAARQPQASSTFHQSESSAPQGTPAALQWGVSQAANTTVDEPHFDAAQSHLPYQGEPRPAQKEGVGLQWGTNPQWSAPALNENSQGANQVVMQGDKRYPSYSADVQSSYPPQQGLLGQPNGGPDADTYRDLPQPQVPPQVSCPHPPQAVLQEASNAEFKSLFL